MSDGGNKAAALRTSESSPLFATTNSTTTFSITTTRINIPSYQYPSHLSSIKILFTSNAPIAKMVAAKKDSKKAVPGPSYQVC